MKILCVHPGIDFAVADVHDGWVRAFRALGCDVVEYNLHDRLGFYMSVRQEDGQKLDRDDVLLFASVGLEAACWRHQPDLVFVTSGTFVPDGVWHGFRKHNIPTVVLFTESPYEDDWQLGLVDRVEPTVTLLNDPTHLTEFRDGKRRAYYMPHAYDPTVHYPSTHRSQDFVFCGTGFPSRIEFFEQVDWTGIDAAFAGSWRGLTDTSPLHRLLTGPPMSCSPNVETADLYRTALVSANLYRTGRESSRADLAPGWALSPRELELAACGTFFVREPRGEGDLVLPMLPTFQSPDQFEELVRWYLAHPDVREQAAESAHAAIANRTFDSHARRLLRLVQ